MAIIIKVKIIKSGYSYCKDDIVGVAEHTANKLVAAGVAEIVGKVGKGSDAKKKGDDKGDADTKEGEAKKTKDVKKADAKTK